MKDETIARCLLSGCLLAAGMEKSIAASGTILEKNNYTAAIAGKNQTNEHTFDYSGETAVTPINSLVIAAYGEGAKNTITVKGNPSVGEKDLKDASGEASLKDARGEVLKEPAHWTIEKTKPIGQRATTLPWKTYRSKIALQRVPFSQTISCQTLSVCRTQP